jgi:predicted O-methyltransferase YrrM
VSQESWRAVDAYLEDRLFERDETLEEVVRACREAGVPDNEVTPAQGRFLQILVHAQGARRVLEVGTLGGYSAIWMARALPDVGRLVTLELDPHHADVARANLARAGVAGRVEVRVGSALESLPRLADEGAGPFDLVFIDADKQHNPEYLEHAVALSRPGTLVVVDNLVRVGAIVDAASDDPSVQGVRRMLDRIANDPRLEATALQTVGRKDWDGFALIRVGRV